MKYATILRELRKSANLTQNALAKALKIGQSTIVGYEQGKNEPTGSILIKYADFFDVSIDYLLGREDDFGNVKPNNGATSPMHTLEEERLLAAFNKLDSRTKSRIIEDCEYFATKTVKV